MKLLSGAVAPRFTGAFLEGREPLDTVGLVTESGRRIDQDSVADLARVARNMFAGNPPASDPWLATRLHCLLRLTRREAATKEFWLHVGCIDAPEHVRWRWGKERSRYLGTDVNQSFSRLWWAAELFREGKNYDAVPGAFSPPDIANTIMRLHAAHNRPFCVAFLRFVKERRTDGEPLIGRQVNNLSTAVNSQLFVAALDAVAPDPGINHRAAADWRSRSTSVRELFEGNPVGPDDLGDCQFSSRVIAARKLLDHVADGARIATPHDPKAGSERPSDMLPPTQNE